MLEVYYGNDTPKVRKKALQRADQAVAESATLTILDTNNYTLGQLADAAGGVSLFGERAVYLIDSASEKYEMYEDVVSQLEALAKSENLFLVIESNLLAAEKKRFAKYATVMEEYKAVAGTRVNNFSLADALARRDKKSLWLLWHEARLGGARPEELLGILWWQLKTLRLADQTKSAAEAGLKDFPYNKAKRALTKFQTGELERLSHSLLTLQHDSRLGLCDLDVAVERWILRV